MNIITDKLYSWASDQDQGTIDQAARTSRLKIVERVALMPDAHVGLGSTVGSVIATKGAVIPAAVGVDIGCGMMAAKTTLTQDDLPSLDPMIDRFEQAIPAGVGKGHEGAAGEVAKMWYSLHKNSFSEPLDSKLETKLLEQLGSLGSGNHFVEICLDESDTVWIMLHSGSRGLGNVLASKHIKIAQALFDADELEDRDLAYVVEGSQEFENYIADMLTCQEYALTNRSLMMGFAIASFLEFVGKGEVTEQINCHHNFTQQEFVPIDKEMRSRWITRKGAISARKGQKGIIPGSMGTRSYIVEGLGNAASYQSCSHGAGRRHSRTQAKKLFTEQDMAEAMQGITWQAKKGQALIDEIPAAYKDIDQVMADQEDLVVVCHTLRQILNYKGC